MKNYCKFLLATQKDDKKIPENIKIKINDDKQFKKKQLTGTKRNDRKLGKQKKIEKLKNCKFI